tara:strand:+ start:3219 stop:4472 length:1254 start_codon:yes stop_codon:yes gene_type:complete
MYTVGGLDIYIHKYIGPSTGDPGDTDATLPVYDTQNPLFIEDLLLLENRDRQYDPDVYVQRGVYRVSDIDFDLTQFGLFLNNDTLFISFHYNDMIDILGRKLMSGDVIEVPNLKDYHPLDTSIVKALPKWYVIQDASYSAEGFSQTWQPHLWRVKATPMVNAQEYNSVTKQAFEPNNIWDPGNLYPAGTVVNNGDTFYTANREVPPGTPVTDTTYWTEKTPDTIADKASTRTKDLQINDAILTQAAVEVPLTGYDTVKFYILPTVEDGQPAQSGLTADQTPPTVDGTQSGENVTPRADGYTVGYLTGDGVAPNGLPITAGVGFPAGPSTGDYALRLDYYPNRLFRFNGSSWTKIEDSVRTTPVFEPATGYDENTYKNSSLRAGFVNNRETVQTNDRGEIPSRQSLSDILKPDADNGG